MFQENTAKNPAYEKAAAEIILFDNSDVVTTSSGCATWSNQNGVGCYYGLTES